jgi:glycosyltransferase involved in cell wall biosynthesis
MFSVVIPTKTISNLSACVAAIRENEPTLKPEHIIVVDDSEGADIAQFCGAGGYSRLQGEKPFVFARNANAGLRFAFENDEIDGAVLLNDDALLKSRNGFTLMANTCKANPEYGIIGATTNVIGNRNQFPKGVGLRDEPRMVCFFCVYIPFETAERVGGLDERYVGYGLDDDDYSFEVRKAGLKIGIHDGCYLDHGSLTSSFRGDPRTPADFQPNLKRFIDKWGVDNWGRTV